MLKGIKQAPLKHVTTNKAVTTLKYCGHCKTYKPIEQFWPRNKNKPDVLVSYCKDCMRAMHKKWVKDNQAHCKTYKTSWDKDHIIERNIYKDTNKVKTQSQKLLSIKAQGCICPGCGIDFSCCNDKGLLIIFEKSHIHNKKCKLRQENDFFWSCRVCNIGVQHDRCGKWLAPLKFKELCII